MCQFSVVGTPLEVEKSFLLATGVWLFGMWA